MEYLFDREQRILDNAIKHINELQDGESVSQEMFKTLVKEYDMVLKQLRKIVKISDRTSEILVSEQKSKQEKIVDLICKVHFDMLTGIYNRHYMEEALNSTIKTLQRSGGGLLSVIMVDIDHFKKYNDTYGHLEGDACLRDVAKALKESITRDDDFVARYGGEEFAIILPNTGENGACIIADKILENVIALNIPHQESKLGCVTISVGVTTGNVEHARDSSDYIKFADDALYMSKRNGRNRYTYLNFRGQKV